MNEDWRRINKSTGGKKNEPFLALNPSLPQHQWHYIALVFVSLFCLLKFLSSFPLNVVLPQVTHFSFFLFPLVLFSHHICSENLPNFIASPNFLLRFKVKAMPVCVHVGIPPSPVIICLKLSIITRHNNIVPPPSFPCLVYENDNSLLVLAKTLPSPSHSAEWIVAARQPQLLFPASLHSAELVLCGFNLPFSCSDFKSPEQHWLIEGMMWATDVALHFLVATLKNEKETSDTNFSNISNSRNRSQALSFHVLKI